MDKSEILPIQEEKSDLADFPFAKTGEGVFVQAYKNSIIQPEFQHKYSPKKGNYEIYSDTTSKYPHLAEKFKNAQTIEKNKIKKNMTKFMDYVATENFKQNIH